VGAPDMSGNASDMMASAARVMVMRMIAAIT
jgi:hypothetical protein